MEYEELRQFILEYVKQNDSFPAKFDVSILSKPIIVEIILTNPNYIDAFNINDFSIREIQSFVLKNPKVILNKLPDTIIDRKFIISLIKKDPNIIFYLTSDHLKLLESWDANEIDYSRLLESAYIRLIKHIYYEKRNDDMKSYVLENDDFFKYMNNNVKNHYLKVVIPKYGEYNNIFKGLDSSVIDDELVKIAAKHLSEKRFIDLFGEGIFKSKYAKIIKDENPTLYLDNVSKEDAENEMYIEFFEKDCFNILSMPLSKTNKKMWNYTLNYSLTHNMINLRKVLSKMPVRYFDKKTLNMMLFKYPSFVKYIPSKAFNGEMVLNLLKKVKEHDKTAFEGYASYKTRSMYFIIKDVEDLVIDHMNKELFDFCYKNKLFTAKIVGNANIGNFISGHPNVFEALADINPSIIKKYKKIEINNPDKYKDYIIKNDPEIIIFVPERFLSVEFVYDCIKENFRVIEQVLTTSKLEKYITSELIDLYVSKYETIRLDYIPEKYLTADIIVKVLKKNKDALQLVPLEKRTRKMYEVAADLGIIEKGMPDDLDEMIKYNKEIIRQRNALDQKKSEYQTYGKYITMYFSDDSIGLKSFCENNNISESKFRKLLLDLENLYPEIYKEYKNMVDIHASEAWNYVLEVINKIDKAFDEGVKNPETKQNTELNIVTYYFVTAMEPKILNRVLRINISREKSRLFYRKIVLNAIDSPRDIRLYYNTVTRINSENGMRTITDSEKKAIVEFANKNKIPKNGVTLSMITKMYVNGEINLEKVYSKIIKYDLEEEKRKELSERLTMIRIQDEIIKILDEKIKELNNNIRRAIL